MAANDIRIFKHPLTVMRFRTEANIKLGILPGDALRGGVGTGTNYVDLVLDGDPEQGTDMFAGVSKSSATNTASADGVIDVEMVGPGTVLEGKANTATNVNTDAKLLGLLFDFVCFDRSAATAAGILTIDEDEGTDQDVHGLCILNGDIVKGTLLVTPTNSTLWRGLV
jgi:hypothetical protein